MIPKLLFRGQKTGTVKLLLTAISGSREGNTFTIEPNQCITFGRTNASTWSFEDDGHMSSIHFEVENTGSDCLVRDLGSTNGTWLNNAKVTSQRLREGDRIRAGKTVVTVEFLQKPLDGFPLEVEPALDEPKRCSAESDLDDSASTTMPPEKPTPTSPPDHGSMLVQRNNEAHLGAERIADHAPSARTQPQGPSTPFDSVDYSEQFSLPVIASALQPQPPSHAPSTKNRKSTPFSDSSYVSQIPAAGQINAFDSKPKDDIATFQIFERRTSAESANVFDVVVGALSQRWSIQLVLHFQKIRSTPPPECKVQPLFNWLPSELARDFSPVRLSWSDAQASPTLLALLPRLCRADACLAFLGKSTVETAAQVEQMLSVGVDRFSEPGGFLPTCWPSSFATLIDVSGPRIAKNLFAQHISGAILCSSWDRNKLVAVVDGSLDADLRDNSFVDVSRISG
jgi:pSer/pThr/pTyr-binding forkhead associated (FHA) protein